MKRGNRKVAVAAPKTEPGGSGAALAAAGALAAVLLAFVIYGPALNGPFVLDDIYLPLGRTDADRLPLSVWLFGRPALGLSYYLNFLVAGARPAAYHVTNVLLHLLNAFLVFITLRAALTERSRRHDVIALTGAALFLAHPLQTEAVAYIAGRSDVLSTLFAYGAIAVFLKYRRPAIGLGAVAAVLGLFVLALLSKQPAVALPAVLIIMDFWWSEEPWRESIKRNFRLHGVLLAGALAGAVWVFTLLNRDTTAGFRVPGISPAEYFFTQCRAFWHYVRLILLPIGQNVDPDFPVSRGLLDHGAVFGLLGMIALLGLAIWIRRSHPLVSAGILIFFALLAPTSSFIPIVDPVAERRVYFAMLGPLLVLAGLLRASKTPTANLAWGGAAVVFLLSFATYSRAALWGDELLLWRDTVEQSPRKMRPRFQLAHLLYRSQQCHEAAREYEAASRLAPPKADLLVDWGLALDCANRKPEALAKLRQAVATERLPHALAQLGMVLARDGHHDEALPLLDEAIRDAPGEPSPWGYRGNVHASQGRLAEAEADFSRALALAPGDPTAVRGLQYLQRLRQMKVE